MLAYLAFQKSFLLLGIISVLLLGLVFCLGNGSLKGLTIDRKTVARVFKKRSGFFWHASLLFMFLFVSTNTFFGFLLPLYAYDSLHMSYEEVGGSVALLSLVTAIATLGGVRFNISRNILMLFVILMIPAMALMPFFGTNLLFLLLLIGIGTGFSDILAEYILAEAVASSKDVSTDIGVIYVPLRLGEFLFLSLGGFVISNWGYPLLFYVSAVLVLLFVVFAQDRRSLGSYPT